MNQPLENAAMSSSTPDRRRLWFEIGVILLVGVVSELIGALAALAYGAAPKMPFWIDAILLTERSVMVCAVACFIMWSSGEGWRAFGFIRWEWRVDLPLAAALLLAAWIAGGVVHSAAAGVLGSPHYGIEQFSMPQSGADHVLLAVMLTANSFAEELVIWGVLFTRVRQLGCGAAPALALCAAVFASYHLYQGPAAALAVGAIGLLHGTVFWLSKRILPQIVAHTAMNLYLYLM